MNSYSNFLCLLLMACCSTCLLAQIDHPSPQSTTNQPVFVAPPGCPDLITKTGRINEANVAIYYNTEARNNRQVIGGIIPHGSPWKASGCAPAHFTNDRYLGIGEDVLPPGRYSVVIQAGDFSWRVMFLRDLHPFTLGQPNPFIELSSMVAEASVAPTSISNHPNYWRSDFSGQEEQLTYGFFRDGMNVLWGDKWLFIPMAELNCVMRINTNIPNFAAVNREFDASTWNQPNDAFAYTNVNNNGFELRVVPEDGKPTSKYTVSIGSEIWPNIREKVANYFTNQGMTVVTDTQHPHEIIVGLE